jgi:hypothetical protein
MANGRPSIAPVTDSGGLGAPVVWASSERIAESLRSNVVIQDDRFTPIRTLTWTNPDAPFGEFPMVVPNAPWSYATDTSLMMVAGPTYTSGGQSFVSLAAGPVGLSYP